MCDWLTPCPSRYSPGMRPGTYRTEGLVSPTGRSGRCEESRPPPGFVQPVASRYTDWAITADYDD